MSKLQGALGRVLGRIVFVALCGLGLVVGAALLFFLLKTFLIVVAIACVLLCLLAAWAAFEIRRKAWPAAKLLRSEQGHAFVHDLGEVCTCLVERLGVPVPKDHTMIFSTTTATARIKGPDGEGVQVDTEHLVKFGAAYRLLLAKHFPDSWSKISEGVEVGVSLQVPRSAHQALRAELPYLEMLDRLAPRGGASEAQGAL